MKFYIEDSTVKLYFSSSDSFDNEQRSCYLLALIQAPSSGVWPTEAEVYIDDLRLEEGNLNFQQPPN